MRTVNPKLVLFSATLSLFTLIGCASDKDSGSQVIITNPNKKITQPTRCKDSDKLSIQATWNLTGSQFGYLIHFGFMGQPPLESLDVDANTTSYLYPEAKRGRSYTLQVASQGRNGQSETQARSVTIPKCADLEEYKKAHPDYREPVEFVFVF
jgi:hypothetical protein